MREPILQTVDRAFTLIEILAHHPEGMRANELAKAMDLNKVTIHRLVSTLAARGFIERSSDGLHWQLGLKVIELGSMRLNSLALKTEAQPYLRQMVQQTGQPAHLAIRDQAEIVYIEKIETVQSMRMYSQIGKRSPVYCTALGKALLTAMTENELRSFIRSLDLKPYTKQTMTDPDQLIDEITAAKKRGYATDNEENEPGVCCLAVPIFDYRQHVIAAISTAGAKCDFIKDSHHPVVDQVKQAAAAISRRMGWLSDQKKPAGFPGEQPMKD